MTVLAAGGIGAGLTGFLVVLVLAIAAVFLFRSMLRHLRRVPPTFEPPPDGQSRPGSADGPSTSATSRPRHPENGA